MGYRYDTYCGLYCGACALVRANEEGRLEEAAKKYGRPREELVSARRVVGCSTVV